MQFCREFNRIAMKKVLFVALAGLMSLEVSAQVSTVTMTTNKPVGTEITLLVNTSKTGVVMDWGNGAQQTYTQSENGVIKVVGKVQGENLLLASNRNLTMLSADDCGLTSIDLSHATTLRSLYLQHNELTEINLAELASLRDLNLSYNALAKVSLTATANPLVENLDLSHNPFTSTTWSYGTANLQYMDLSDTGLKVLTMTKNTNLTSLIAENNQLGAVNLTYSPKLTLLQVSNNNVSTLRMNDNMTDMQQFFAANNKINTPINLSQSKGLNTVDVAHNQLSEVILPTSVKLYAYDCGDNALTFAALPRSTYQPTLYFNYQPQADFAFGTLTGVHEGAWSTSYMPWVMMSPGYDQRQNADYVVDMTGLRGGSTSSSVKFAFYEVAEDGTETALTQASASNKEQDFTNISGKVTFQRALTKAYGVMTDEGYPDLVIRTTPFAVLDPNSEGIHSTEMEQGSGVAYDLQGRRVETMHKGLYIINNKKTLRR